MRLVIRQSAPFGLLCLVLASGCMCNSRPSRVDPPSIDPDSAAAAAMEQYDTDTDGKLSPTELEVAGSIGSSANLLDSNGDGSVSKEEVADSLKQMVANGTGLMTFSCQVTLDGAALSGATLKFIPETFMQGKILPAEGVSGADGIAAIVLDSSQLPADQRDLTGVIHPGFYRVEITHPQANMSAKYNTETKLGKYVSQQTTGNETTVFALRSN